MMPLSVRQSLAAILCCIAVIASPLSSTNADETDIRIGILALAPYGYQDSKGNWKGNWYDIAHAIASQGALQVNISVLPVARITTWLKTKELDCFFSIQSPFSEQHFTRIAPLGFSLVSGALPSAKYNLKSYDDLKDLSIAVSLGTKLGEPFDSDDSLKKVSTRDYASSMKMLHQGRVDAAVGVLGSLKFNAALHELTKLDYGQSLEFKRLPVNLYCTESSAAKGFWPKIRNVTKRLIDSGEIERILAQYRR